jgi:hypothetical protein
VVGTRQHNQGTHHVCIATVFEEARIIDYCQYDLEYDRSSYNIAIRLVRPTHIGTEGYSRASVLVTPHERSLQRPLIVAIAGPAGPARAHLAGLPLTLMTSTHRCPPCPLFDTPCARPSSTGPSWTWHMASRNTCWKRSPGGSTLAKWSRPGTHRWGSPNPPCTSTRRSETEIRAARAAVATHERMGCDEGRVTCAMPVWRALRLYQLATDEGCVRAHAVRLCTFRLGSPPPTGISAANSSDLQGCWYGSAVRTQRRYE